MLFRLGALLAGGVQPIVDTLTFDDTYYYLNTAWHHKAVGFPTFDGYNRTNGVQFLYYWLLYGISHFFSGRYEFLIATLWLCGLMAAAAVPLSYVTARVLGLRWGALLTAASITYLACNRNRLVSGVENALHLVVVLGLFLVYFLHLRKPLGHQRLQSATYPMLVGLCILNCWCRLDAWPLSVAVFLHASASLWRKDARSRRLILTAAAAALTAGAVQLGTNYWMGGSAVPVSGLWKVRVGDGGMGSSVMKTLALEAEAGEGEGALPFFKRLDLSLTLRTVRAGLSTVFAVPRKARAWAPAVLLVLALAYATRSSRGGSAERRRLGGRASNRTTDRAGARLRALGGVMLAEANDTPHSRRLAVGYLLLGAGVGAHLLVLASTAPASLDRSFWYFAPLHAYLALSLGVAVSLVPETLPLLRRPGPFSPQALAVAALIVMAALVGLERHRDQLEHEPTSHFRRYQAAVWMRDNLPTEARIASFNAGELGYFSERSVTNLDGLINSFEYYENRMKYAGRMDRYMVDQGITYFADYRVPKELRDQTALVQGFELEDDKELVLLRLVSPGQLTRGNREPSTSVPSRRRAEDVLAHR
ncbi:MAG TPA: hypothetical protein VNB06_13680 [Thermoanaerobaculia bacterium]|nr:hypothetical protein [Thermoanaerobaculia bacterium]